MAMVLRANIRRSLLQAVRPAFGTVARCPSYGLPSQRAISSSAASKVAKVLEAELKSEKESYTQPEELQKFLKSSPFKFVDTEGDVNLALEREVGDKVVRIEWQLSSPFVSDGENAEGEEEDDQATEVSVTVQDKKSGAGLQFFCSTQTGEDHRYVIGNVRSFASASEKENVSSYNGPDFEDLDDKVQESFDEYLAEVGMNAEVCDFIDATASDKEQREYVRWLQTTMKFFQE